MTPQDKAKLWPPLKGAPYPFTLITFQNVNLGIFTKLPIPLNPRRILYKLLGKTAALSLPPLRQPFSVRWKKGRPPADDCPSSRSQTTPVRYLVSCTGTPVSWLAVEALVRPSSQRPDLRRTRIRLRIETPTIAAPT